MRRDRALALGPDHWSTVRQGITATVFGGSGFLGGRLLARLSSNGVRAFNISRSNHVDDTNLAIDRVLRDDFRLPGFENQEIVCYHFIGSSRETESSSLWESNYGITRRIIDFCRRSKAARIVYFGGYGIDWHALSSESYYYAKGLAIKEIINSGLPYTIFNPSYIVGTGDEFSAYLKHAQQLGSITIPGDGNYRLQPLLVEDVIEVALRVAACELNSTRSVVDLLGEPISFREFVERIFRTSGRDVAIRSTPMVNCLREALFSRNPTFSASELCILSADRVGPPTRDFLGVAFRPLAQIIESVAKALDG
jgi:nucleoside-diphosphate-sugar epimerase